MGISLPTLRERERSLQEKGLLSYTMQKDYSGNCQVVRQYDFEKCMNTIALKFIETDEKIEDHDKRIRELEDLVNKLMGNKKDIVID